jgi:hypothetical protein
VLRLLPDDLPSSRLALLQTATQRMNCLCCCLLWKRFSYLLVHQGLSQLSIIPKLEALSLLTNCSYCLSKFSLCYCQNATLVTRQLQLVPQSISFGPIFATFSRLSYLMIDLLMIVRIKYLAIAFVEGQLICLEPLFA